MHAYARMCTDGMAQTLFMSARGASMLHQTRSCKKLCFTFFPPYNHRVIAQISQVNKSLLRLHAAASDATDPQFCDFLESNYLEEQAARKEQCRTGQDMNTKIATR